MRKIKVVKSWYSSLIAVVLLIQIVPGSLNGEDSIPNYFQYSNRVFKSNIKTIQLYRSGWALSPPLLKLGSDESLLLSFDDLDADGKEYMFTIVHCDVNWQPSPLEQYEYIDGYNEDYIYEYRFSTNTIVPYAHYELKFPTSAKLRTKRFMFLQKLPEITC